MLGRNLIKYYKLNVSWSAFETAVWEQNLRGINPQKGRNDATTTTRARAAESGVTVVSSSGSTAYYGLKIGDVGTGKR